MVMSFTPLAARSSRCRRSPARAEAPSTVRMPAQRPESSVSRSPAASSTIPRRPEYRPACSRAKSSTAQQRSKAASPRRESGIHTANSCAHASSFSAPRQIDMPVVLEQVFSLVITFRQGITVQIEQPHAFPPLKCGTEPAAFKRPHQMVELHRPHGFPRRGDDLDDIEPGLKRARMLHQAPAKRSGATGAAFGVSRPHGGEKRTFAARFDLHEGNIRVIGRDYVDLPNRQR